MITIFCIVHSVHFFCVIWTALSENKLYAIVIVIVNVIRIKGEIYIAQMHLYTLW